MKIIDKVLLILVGTVEICVYLGVSYLLMIRYGDTIEKLWDQLPELLQF